MKILSTIIATGSALFASYKFGSYHQPPAHGVLPSTIDINALQEANPNVKIEIISVDPTSTSVSELKMPQGNNHDTFFDSIINSIDTFILQHEPLYNFLNSTALIIERINLKIKQTLMEIFHNIIPEIYFFYFKFIFWGIILYILVKILILIISVIHFEIKILYAIFYRFLKFIVKQFGDKIVNNNKLSRSRFIILKRKRIKKL